ncbi:MAG: hypothetical protein MUC77_07650 [Chromatiaceae bacterium]|jgi:DNA-directed RNA polymerase subunit RPC12/RpoP|nr:hypothetical protein [Chromatiaceae bacterium]
MNDLVRLVRRIARGAGYPRCPRCGSERLALLFPPDIERTDEVVEALRGGWILIPDGLPPEPSPAWQCAECGQYVYADGSHRAP